MTLVIKMCIKHIKIFFAGILMLTGTAGAQLGLSLEAQSGYTTNAFANYLARPDYYTGLTGRVLYDRVNEIRGYRWYYKGELSAYKQYRDRTYRTHALGFAFYRNWGEHGNRLNAGASLSKRYHSEAYNWYEQAQLNAFVNVKIVFTEQFYGYAGLNLNWRDFTLLEAFSHYQSALFYRLSFFMDSGTTLIFETDLFTKQYYSYGPVSDVSTLPEVVTLGEGTSQQVAALVRVAQSITPKTGLSLELLLRRNLTNSTRYLGSASGYYYSDEEIFDDIYGYHGEEVSLTLKRLLPRGLQLSAGARVTLKRYDDRLALQLTGEPYDDLRLRKDTRRNGWVTLEKRLRMRQNWQPLTLSLSWYAIQNNSNDPYYSYGSGYWTLGVSHDF